jgi:hypothetical protein
LGRNSAACAAEILESEREWNWGRKMNLLWCPFFKQSKEKNYILIVTGIGSLSSGRVLLRIVFMRYMQRQYLLSSPVSSKHSHFCGLNQIACTDGTLNLCGIVPSNTYLGVCAWTLPLTMPPFFAT